MKNDDKSTPHSNFHRQRLSNRSDALTDDGVEPTLRAELFSAERMELHGIALAKQHALSPRSSSDRLLKRLDENAIVLQEACESLTVAARSNRRITPAGEWLLDNYYLVEEQIRIAQRHLPKGYNRELPRLIGGAVDGLPRVYALALETISHGDGRVDDDSLARFIAAYQTIQPLTLGELWAIPIMLRLALIENLRRVAARVLADWKYRDMAGEWADTFAEIAEQDPKSVVLGVADMARSKPPMTSAFVAEIARRLQGQSAVLAMPLTWIEQRLAENGSSVEHQLQLEAQQQAADQVSIGNSIGSLRHLSAIDWHAFVERLSIVEKILSTDPAGVYADMDFDTRDQYRHVVERLARAYSQPETKVAETVLELSRRRALPDAIPAIDTHVGYYLIDDGLPLLEKTVATRPRVMAALGRALVHRPLTFYLGLMLVLGVLLAWPLVGLVAKEGHSPWTITAIAVAVLLGTSQLALGLVNWVVTLLTRPKVLPRMDYSLGIPPSSRSIVVIPSLLGSMKDVEDLTDELEVRFLANRDDHLHFGLLSDFMDAPTEAMPGDKELLAFASERIELLNGRYAQEGNDRFYLFHRPRRYNKADNVWMGYERKRGKLSDLNTLLRTGKTDNFIAVVGRVEALRGVKYVITLDTDTQLPRDTASQFISAMSHPLNRPIYDPNEGRVTRGYGILQPRVGVSLPNVARSRYAILFGSDAGIDPYTRMVSDVYQDLFDEGSFIGKGVYDVDAFMQSLDDRFPDNTILSHDLIEGCYARSALLTDVQLYEEYPSSYVGESRRRHRWIRGDWQLLPWLFPRAPNATSRWAKNPLSALSRWKIFDNLRRSLVGPALIALLLVGWFALDQFDVWTLAVVALIFMLPLLSALLGIARKSHDVAWSLHLKATISTSAQQFLRTAYDLMTLPYEAYYSLDAILRSLWRMVFSRRNLLQWQTSREVEKSGVPKPLRLYRMMWINPVLSACTLLALAVCQPLALPVAIPFLLLWSIGPFFAGWFSQPRAEIAFTPTAEQVHFLRVVARRIWGFFEKYVADADNWLPPDNVQELPVEVIAHRTSPTNMGLALLSGLAAYDFGYITVGRLLDRTSKTLQTMQGLTRYRGHFYNWYDTVSLQPLSPHYISSVDSGNLAGHLLTLRPGLLSLLDAPLFDVRLIDGVADTVNVLVESARAGVGMASLKRLRDHLDPAKRPSLTKVGIVVSYVDTLRDYVDELSAAIPANESDEVEFWYQCVVEQVADIVVEVDCFSFLRQRDASPSTAPSPEAIDADIPTLNVLLRNVSALSDRSVGLLTERGNEILRLAKVTADLAVMDFTFLYDTRRDLLSIGYNLDDRRLDAGCYDLLASEARLATFVTIAQGQLPQDGWFALGRLLTTTRSGPVLLSWSGSMFEYLMPMLVMPTFEGTLLDQTCRAAVGRQMEYGQQAGLPWGVSESGFNTVDVHLNYQYRAFGVPGLGLKRGLTEDVVIAPYASVMALMVAPSDAYINLKRLTDEGRRGRFGFYEAVDYTPARVPHGQSAVVVSSFMAHHQGMSLLSIAYTLLGQPMQKRFEADPQFRASMLLLQERVPKTPSEYLHASGLPTLQPVSSGADTTLRIFQDPNMPRPAVQLLSNGRYHVMVSSSGTGYSRCKDNTINRWYEDITSDHWGQFCYLRDVETGEFWSTTYQPTLGKPDHYEAIFSDARAEFRVRANDYDTHTEVVVSPEDDIELRRVRLINRGRTARTIELTTYAEVVIAPAAADAAHPAFSNLFVQTEWVASAQALICTRRPRSNDEQVPWMCHVLAVHDAKIDSISYETDRARFIGRGRSVARPIALSRREPQALLSNSVGSVLDPIVAIRCRITLEPEESATIDIVTGIADSRDACQHLAEKYRDRHLADRVFDLAWTHSQVLLQQLNASHADARLYERMAASIVYPNTLLRAEPSILLANRRGQSGLWGQSISGDLPIVLLRIADTANIELVRQLVQAHAYWRMKGLAVDLVIWNEDQASYRQQLQDLILGLIASVTEAGLIDRPGGIFVRPVQQLSVEDRILVQSVARIVLLDTRGSLAEQIERRRVEPSLPRLDTTRIRRIEGERSDTAAQELLESLELRNAYGGFTADKTEYVMVLRPGHPTPAPWSNVLANPDFGCVISESGGSYTWSENAHEFRLTPWHNDPITDSSGEAIYLRDEETGRYWSPTPLPHRGRGTYVTRHGFGYTVFEHTEDGIQSELWVYVSLHASIKFSVLKVRNLSGRPRRLSATGYVEWVLSDVRAKSLMHVVTESDPVSGALFARNAYNTSFEGRIAVFDTDATVRTVTADRSEFLGRNGNLRTPAAMLHSGLSGRLGPGLDPCAAIQVPFELDKGESREVIFRLGAARDPKGANELAQRYRGSSAAAAALDEVRMHWHWTLGKVQVETPDPGINALANGWLMYQVIASRFWGRSGYYQSGGAFGFRDQLQDTMAMVHASPYSSRQHLLLSAEHQFVEGDVLHWWHPPMGNGVRTHCSDDYLWLPLATSRYVLTTADTGVLDEKVGYLEGRPVKPDEESYYDLPMRSDKTGTLYEHCVRAIERGMSRGSHGLPLMGAGDWNDGMNRVGEKGKGESVWLGFFLHTVLTSFADVARRHNDEPFAKRCEDEAKKLAENLEKNAWDGEWYRRAYFDDGTPLGSKINDECRIDSIAQSWSVLSGVASEERRTQAMASLEKYLVKRDTGLIQLLDPPFDKSQMDPGYIKGYVPGVRENGGQYTHAAVWAIMAFAAMGDAERAWELVRMISPITHGSGGKRIETYKVEPYVIVADIYEGAAHQGRGGWSWYTGSAGWMYRLILESLLGLCVEGETLTFKSLLPADWPSYKLSYRHRETDYHIEVHQSPQHTGPCRIVLNGEPVEGERLRLVDDGGEHNVEFHL